LAPSAPGAHAARRRGLADVIWWERLRWPAVFWAAGVALFLVYVQFARRIGFGSDGAVIAQQGWEWAHGNMLLRGWELPDITFYTIEVPEFAVLELLRGAATPVIVQIGEALNLTLMVLLAALVAKGRATGREGVIRALIAAGILFAPTYGSNGTLMLGNPDHLATQLPVLAVWLILDRARPRWWVPVTVAALLAWARVSDTIVLLEAEIPLLTVCAVRMFRRGGPVRGQWYEMSLTVAAIAAEGCALLVLRLIRAAGGFSAYPLNETFAQVSTLSSHVWVTVESVLDLYGANFSGQPLHASMILMILALDVAGVLLAAAGTWYAVRRFFSSDLMIQVVTVTMITALLAYTLLGGPTAGGGAHDLMPVLPAGAVLASRLPAAPPRRGVILALTIAVALKAGFLVRDAAQPIPDRQPVALATWLQQHHLSYGLANYYAASAVSVDSGGTVMVAPVNRRGGQLVLSPWNSTTSWYNPAAHDATFFIANQMQACPRNDAAIWIAAARRAFGPPTQTYSVAGAQILVWNTNLLDGNLIPVPVARPSAC
jgi:hypothetical protein